MHCCGLVKDDKWAKDTKIGKERGQDRMINNVYAKNVEWHRMRKIWRLKDKTQRTPGRVQATLRPEKLNYSLGWQRGHGGCSLSRWHQSLSESEFIQSEIVALQRYDQSGRDRPIDTLFRVFSSQIRDCSLEKLQLEYQRDSLYYWPSTISHVKGLVLSSYKVKK